MPWTPEFNSSLLFRICRIPKTKDLVLVNLPPLILDGDLRAINGGKLTKIIILQIQKSIIELRCQRHE